ncbi:MAG: cell division protein FtsA, partial [Wohlfahrtiimonas sp.]
MVNNNRMTEEKEPGLVVGLDIGTSKILAVVAEVHDDKVVVRGLSSQKTYGVSGGTISDIEQVS